jgi:hypothetical protein
MTHATVAIVGADISVRTDTVLKTCRPLIVKFGSGRYQDSGATLSGCGPHLGFLM